MKKIENVVVIGMGALGVLFGQMMHKKFGDERFCFLMDEERAARHKKDVYTINGEVVRFPIASPKQYIEEHTDVGGNYFEHPDFIMIATKYSGLRDAGTMAKEIAGEDTIIISILNGISSEDILAEKFPREQIVDAIALGMDAVRDGTDLTYENTGRIRIGATMEAHYEKVDALVEFFDRVGLPYEVRDDIRKDMWNKLMMNVGINQACMVHETNYGGALHNSEARSDMDGAMYEVIKIANLEGVELTKDDYQWNIDVFETLNPEGTPSMRQDAMAKRRTEVDLFAGTIIRLAEKHGVDVPVNEKFYRIIKDMESAF